MSDDTYDTEVSVHRVTDKAAYVSETGDEDDAVWLPIGSCEWDQAHVYENTTVKVSVPQWLAEEKGLV